MSYLSTFFAVHDTDAEPCLSCPQTFSLDERPEALPFVKHSVRTFRLGSAFKVSSLHRWAPGIKTEDLYIRRELRDQGCGHAVMC